MALALSASFGSVQAWQQDFVATCQAPDSALPWLLLCFEPMAGRLVHRRAASAGAVPKGAVLLLALALPEPTAPGDLAQAISWPQVYEHYQHAVHSHSDHLAADPLQLGDALRLDVRRDVPFQQARTMLPGALWRDPAQVGVWAAELPRHRPVLVYCIYGHEVGRCTALRLRAEGVDARFLPGGIDAWAQRGQPLQDKPVAA